MRKLSDRRKLKSKDPNLIQLLRDKTAHATFAEPVVVEATTVQHEADNLWYVHLQFPGEDEYYAGPGFESQAVAEDKFNRAITESIPPYNLPLKFVIRPNDSWMEADPDRIAKELAQLEAAMAAIAAAPGENLVRFMFEGERYKAWRQGRNEPILGGIAFAPDTLEYADCGPDPFEAPLLPGERGPGYFKTKAEAMAAAKKAADKMVARCAKKLN
jgi:hypothetical protein